MQPSHATLKSLLKDPKLSGFLTSPLKETLSALPTCDANWIQEEPTYIQHLDTSWLNAEQLRLYHLCSSSHPSMQTFAKSKLWQSIKPSYLLPFAVAKELELGQLVTLSKADLMQLIHLLGLYDLALDARKIIQKNTKQAIELALSEHQKTFFHSIASNLSVVDFGRLNLNKWDGSKETLQAVLFHRGLNRFGKALHSCDKSVLWYLTRRLNRELNDQLMKMLADINNPKAQKALLEEVQHALRTLL